MIKEDIDHAKIPIKMWGIFVSFQIPTVRCRERFVGTGLIIHSKWNPLVSNRNQK